MMPFGRYSVQAQVGIGGMGTVYRARDLSLNREVAIKLLIAGRQANEAQRRRFQREVQALAQLRHPNLLAVHASGEVRGVPYLVTERLASDER